MFQLLFKTKLTVSKKKKLKSFTGNISVECSVKYKSHPRLDKLHSSQLEKEES